MQLVEPDEVVDRTNDVLEQFFGSAEQGLRRCAGRAHLGLDQETSRLGRPDRQLAESGRHADPVRHTGQLAAGLRSAGRSAMHRTVAP